MTIAEIDEALTRFVLQSTVHLHQETDAPAQANGSSDPQSAAQAAIHINFVVQRVATVSLDQLDDVIVDLRQLREFLHNEGERIQQQISGFVRLNKAVREAANIIGANVRDREEIMSSVGRSGGRPEGESLPGDAVRAAAPTAASAAAGS
jgi:hypothetical protein